MGSIGAGEFTVTVTAKDVVAAPTPALEHWVPLSNLDLVLPRVTLDVGVFFCYGVHDDWKFEKKASTLKKALSEVLVSFYVFAGEVVENPAGEPEILCNNRGVDFFEASAKDVELRELSLHEPDSCMEGKLLPKKTNGILCVQITELKCGATVVGCTFDHRVADGVSVNMFLFAWAHIAATGSTTIKPCFRRSLLNPRHPLPLDPSINDTFVTLSSLPPPPSGPTGPTTISRVYNLSLSQLTALQTLATNTKPPTKLQTVSAFLWKLIAQHASEFQNDTVSTKNTCTLGVVVDGRQRLGPAMASYFGNVVSVPFAQLGVKELTKMSLPDVADAVGGFLAGAVTKDHFLDLIDWVEAHRPEPIIAKVYTQGTEAEPAFVVSSGQRFPITELDFGWGTPVFGLCHFPWGGSAGYVMPMPSPKRNGDWIVYMHLFESQFDFIEKNAFGIFQPFSLDLVSK